MAKVSRTIIYAALAGVVIYAVVLLTEPEKPAKKTLSRTTTRTAVALPGFTVEDMTARFPRYQGVPRDAFQPKIVPKKKEAALALGALGGGTLAELWALTGVSTVNKVVNALVESVATGESVFLKVGDKWQGLRVVSIEPTTVKLVNDKGVPVRLGFADPNKQKPVPGAAAVAPLLLATPVPAPSPVAVTPVDPVQDRAARRAERRAGRQGGGGQE